MQISKGIYSNTDKFIVGNSIKFCYSGKLFNDDVANDEALFFCYSQTKPKKNQTQSINKVEMTKTDIGSQLNFNLEHLGGLYFSFELGDQRDNNRGHWYKIDVEEMPVALFVLKQQSLPQKLSRFDYIKDQIKSTLSRAFDTFSKLRNINSYSNKEQEKNQ